MPIPTSRIILLPLLQLLAEGREYSTGEYVEQMAIRLQLTPEEQSQMLASGSGPVFAGRVQWAATDLVHAGLVERSGRGRIRITDRGRHTLSENHESLDWKYLRQFPEYARYEQGSKAKPPDNGLDGENNTQSGNGEQTPTEVLEASYQQLRRSLSEDLLTQVKQISPAFFERLVIDVLVAMGYGGSRRDAAKAVGRSGDGGIDGVINEDKLGLDVVYVQAKRWDGVVGRPVIQGFAGSLEGRRARKGVFITTSKFTADARDYVNRIEKRIVLIDGEELAELMIDHGVGVVDVARYEVKRVDEGYFGDA